MLRVVDLSTAPPDGADLPPGVIVAFGSPRNEYWLNTATFTLTEDPSTDTRVVTVDSVPDTLAELAERCAHWPHSSAVCDDVLRTIEPDAPAVAGVITESLAYSTLQAGPEFARWLVERGPATHARHRRPGGRRTRRRHPAYPVQSAATPQRVLHRCARRIAGGAGRSAVGPVGGRDRVERQRTIVLQRGDLAEFGTFADPASAHLARTRHSPALALDGLTARLGRACRAVVHGRVLGSGLEMAAFCGWVEARDNSVLGLPELSLGLIPGAGGSVSVTRRIGRWRTAYLVLSGRTIDADTALAWGLVDVVG